MINWDEFEHIHVIKKLKQILGTWWNVDTLFTDDRGVLKGFQGKENTIKNPLVQFLLDKDDALSNLSEFINKTMEELRSSRDKYTIKTWDFTGFDVGIVPIYIENDFVGTVIALGFFKDEQHKEQLKAVQQKFLSLGVTQDVLDKSITNIKYINEDDKKHFFELVELVAQEIVTLHLEISSRENQISELNKELGIRYKYDNMIGKSKPMQDLYSLLDKIRSAESTVLIQGENGTGKELIAKAIHYNSPRKDKHFVIQNCSAFNDNLLESELFGHVKGSFTGAIRDKKGLFEQAHNGTFFLDEIGDTSPTMQVKLLRVLQEGTFLPVGATEPKKVDVRIIAATNRDLKDMVEKGLFREDLYYRLNVINLRVPPLRERKEDIPLLIEYFLDKETAEGSVKKTINKRALEKLYDYSWPGNIRELQNEIERLIVLAGSDDKIVAEMLSTRITEDKSKNNVQGARKHGRLKDALEELEIEMIREGLRRTGWNKSRLAKELGISRAGLIMKVEKYGLDKRKLLK